MAAQAESHCRTAKAIGLQYAQTRRGMTSGRQRSQLAIGVFLPLWLRFATADSNNINQWPLHDALQPLQDGLATAVGLPRPVINPGQTIGILQVNGGSDFTTQLL